MKVLCYLLIYGGLTMSVNKKVITLSLIHILNINDTEDMYSCIMRSYASMKNKEYFIHLLVSVMN